MSEVRPAVVRVCPFDPKPLERWLTGRWKTVASHDRHYETHFDDRIALPWPTELAFFVRIPPGGRIHRHTDPYSRRYHIPVVTNERAVAVFDAEHHMAVGWVYSFAADRPHAFVNDGDTDRIHLIFDVAEATPPPG